MACQRQKRAVLPAWQLSNGACVLIFRGEKRLDTADDAFSGPIVPSWERLSSFIAEFWTAVARNTGFEWFQWLAERMAEREARTLPVPAYLAHRDWKPGDVRGRS
jgi:hypothetical protein